MRDNFKKYQIASRVTVQRSADGWTARLITFFGDIVFKTTDSTRMGAIKKASEHKRNVHRQKELEAKERSKVNLAGKKWDGSRFLPRPAMAFVMAFFGVPESKTPAFAFA